MSDPPAAHLAWKLSRNRQLFTARLRAPSTGRVKMGGSNELGSDAGHEAREQRA